MKSSMITVAILAFLGLTRCWGKCRDKWVYNIQYDACIRLFTNKKNFQDAVNTCYRYGSVLIMPKTKAKDQALDKLIRDHVTDDYVWISANDITRENYWHWGDGENLGYDQDWQSGEPNDGGENGEDCAFVSATNFLWLDDSCSKPHYFACEEIKPTLQISPPDSIIHPNKLLRLTCVFHYPLGGNIRYKFWDGNRTINKGLDNMHTVTKRKLGSYGMYCEVAHSPSGGAFRSRIRPITVAEAHLVTDTIIVPGAELILECKLEAPKKGLTYTFLFGSEKYEDAISTKQLHPNVLGQFKASCTAHPPLPSLIIFSNEKTIWVADPPKLLKKPAKSHIPGGTKSVFTCAFGPTHLQTIRYTFYHYDEVVQHGTNNTMEIIRSGLIDSGSYNCTMAFNTETPIPSNRIDLTVHETPRLEVYPPERSVMSGTKIDILCQLRATNPEVIYTFVHEKVLLQTGKDNHYVLEHAELEHSGDFSCTAQYRNFLEESRKHTIFVHGVGCPVPAVTDDYTRRLLDSITPREETIRWGKRQTVEPERKPRDEL